MMLLSDINSFQFASAFNLATGGKNAHWQKLLKELPLNNNTQPTMPTMLLWFPRPYAAVAPISETMLSLPTKLVDDLPHTSIVTPIKVIWEIFIIFVKFSTFLHHSKFIAVSIIAVTSSSIGQREDNEISDMPGGLAGGQIGIISHSSKKNQMLPNWNRRNNDNSENITIQQSTMFGLS
jgi:hypothetical protein